MVEVQEAEVLDPRAVRAGEVLVAERWWLDLRGLVPEMVLQTLVARPAPVGEDAHQDLVLDDDETRGWALLSLHALDLDPARHRVRLAITDRLDVPPSERGRHPKAPNALPTPDPVFAALEEVEDAHAALRRGEVRRVSAAVDAWRAARAEEGQPGASGTPYQNGFFLDLGMKLQVAAGTARAMVQSAETLQSATPAVWALFIAGKVPWRAMQAVHAALDGLEGTVLPDFDAGAARKVLEIPVPRLPEALRRLAERLQPTTADDRHDRASRRRHVAIVPAADGMGWMHAFLPMSDLLGLDHQLTKAAVAAAGRADEDRGIQQLRADVLRDGLRGVLRTKAAPADPDLLVPHRRGVEARVAILIPAMTALGHSTVPATLQGYGPIGIRTAMRLAGEAKSWIRVLTDPFTGAIQSLGRRKYRPTKDMRTLIRLLDGGGRGPGCPRGPDEVDLDHNRAFRHRGEQGDTAIDNLVSLSRLHHGVKTAGAAEVDLLRDRSTVWQTSCGNKYVTRPHDPLEATPIPPDLIDPDDCPF